MPVILGAADRTEKKSNTPYIGVHFMATSSSKYYIYATNLSQIPLPGYCLRIYI